MYRLAELGLVRFRFVSYVYEVVDGLRQCL